MRPAGPRVGVLLGMWLAGLATATAQTGPEPVVRRATVSGRVVAPVRTVLQSGAVIMNPAAGDTLASPATDGARFLPDGSFTFRNVAPGVYQLRARAQAAGDAVTLFAGYRVQVSDRDVTGLELVLRRGAIVTGTVEVVSPDGTAPDFAEVRVRAPFVDGSSFADTLTGRIREDGTFRLAGIMEGEHYLSLDGLPAPWVLKDAQWRGADVADASFTAVSGETIQGVRLVVGVRASEVGGLVSDSAGQPVPHATVIISPVDFQSWLGGNRRFVVVHADAGGRYRHRGLPPGEYRVVAARDAEDADRRALRKPNRLGAVVRLGDGDIRTIDLVLTGGVVRLPAAR